MWESKLISTNHLSRLIHLLPIKQNKLKFRKTQKKARAKT